jgi:cytochrome c-type biogenesis protein CcmE
MNPVRKKRLLVVSASLASVFAIIALSLTAIGNNADVFYAPKQIDAGEAPIGELIRIGGLVVKGSVKRDDESLKVSFDLTDNAGTVTVWFDGILPDLFREGQGIITLGRLESKTKFNAEEVLAKHDEKYMSPEVADAIKKAEADAKARQKDASED